MKITKYKSKFKEEVAKQAVDLGQVVPDVANKLGFTKGLLYVCVKKFDETIASKGLNVINRPLLQGS